MIASALYERTLAGYTALLNRGEGISLNKYCKIHHVSNRGMRYWMKKYSIPHPGLLPSAGSVSSHRTNSLDKSAISSTEFIPLVMQPATDKKDPVVMQSSLRDVHLTTAVGIVVCIKEISPADLAALILSCNTR